MNFKHWLILNEGMINVSAKIYTEVITDYFEKLREYKALGKMRVSTESYPLIDNSKNILEDTSFSFLIGYFKKVTLNVKYDKFKTGDYIAYYDSPDFKKIKIFKGMEFNETIVLNLKLLDVNYNHDYITLIQHEITHFIQDLEKIYAYLKSLERQLIYLYKKQKEEKVSYGIDNEIERIYKLLNFGNVPAEDPLEKEDMPLAGISPLQITKKTMRDKKVNFSGIFKGKDDFETQKVKFINQGNSEEKVAKYLDSFKTIKTSNDYKELEKINDPIRGLENIKDRTNIDAYKTFNELKIFVDYILKSYKYEFRIDHDKRPVEFQTNLISLVGDFQKNYFEQIVAGNLKNENGYEIPDDLYSFTSDGYNLGWKNKIKNDDKILEFLNNRNNKKLFLKAILINLEKTDSKYRKLQERYYKLILVKENPELYKWYLSNIYKEFVNKDIDMNYLKLLNKQDKLNQGLESNKKNLLIDTLESLKGKKEQKYYAHDIKFFLNHDANLYQFKIDPVKAHETWNAYNILKAFYGDQKKYNKEIKNGRRMDYEKLNDIFKIIKKDKVAFRKEYAGQKNVLNKIYEDYEKFINAFLDDIVKSYEIHYQNHKNDYDGNVKMEDILPKPPTKNDFIEDFNIDIKKEDVKPPTKVDKIVNTKSKDLLETMDVYTFISLEYKGEKDEEDDNKWNIIHNIDDRKEKISNVSYSYANKVGSLLETLLDHQDSDHNIDRYKLKQKPVKRNIGIYEIYDLFQFLERILNIDANQKEPYDVVIANKKIIARFLAEDIAWSYKKHYEENNIDEEPPTAEKILEDNYVTHTS